MKDNAKEKKYVFILTFKTNFGILGDHYVQAEIHSNTEELSYSTFEKAQNELCEMYKSKQKPDSLLLLNCTRFLNDKIE